MVLVSPSMNPSACWDFDGEILVLHHPTTISCKYQAMVHCGSTRQTASIIFVDKEHLRTGDKAKCKFRFIKNPEYIKPGTRMVFREGRTKAVGSVTQIHPVVPGSLAPSIKPRHHKSHMSKHLGDLGHGKGRKRGGKKHTQAKENPSS